MSKKIIPIILILITISSVIMYYGVKHQKAPKKLKERIEVLSYDNKTSLC